MIYIEKKETVFQFQNCKKKRKLLTWPNEITINHPSQKAQFCQCNRKNNRSIWVLFNAENVELKKVKSVKAEINSVS